MMEQRMKPFRYLTFCLLILGLFWSGAFGSGFTFDGLGVKARGMGGAFRAIADDWSAAYYNPAGLTGITDNIMAGNITFIHNRFSTKQNVEWGGWQESGYINNRDLYNHHTILNVPQVGTVVPLPIWGETVFGFSIMQIFDQNHSWELFQSIDAYNQKAFPTHQFYNNLDVVAFQLSAAREFMEEQLSVGVGLSLLRGDLIYTGLSLLNNPMPTHRPYEKIPQWYKHDGMGWGFGYKLGLMYHLNEKIDLALVATGPSSINLSGDFSSMYYIGDSPTETGNELTDENYFTSGIVQETSADFETSLDLPASIAGGIAYRVNDKLIVDLDVELTFWSAFEGFDFTYTGLSGLPDTNYPVAIALMDQSSFSVPVNWTNAGRVMLGADYKLKDYVSLRCGGSIDQTAITDETFIPQFMDLYTKYSFGVGVGFEINYWQLDLTTTYTHHKKVDIQSISYYNDDLLMDNVPALYKADNYQTIFGVSYRF